MDYEGIYLSPDDPTVRIMLVGNRVPPNFRRSLDHHGIEWKEITLSFLTNFLREKNDPEALQCFSGEELDADSIAKENGNYLNKKETKRNNRGSMLKNKKIDYKNFCQQLLERLNKKTNIFSGKKRQATEKTRFWGTTAGKQHLAWNCFSDRVELRAYTFDKNNVQEITMNKRRYESLQIKRKEIEKAFGEPLTWDYKEGRTYQCICSYTIKGIENEANWPAIQEDLVDRMVRLKKALQKYIEAFDE
ncbi:MAG: DUF4268 domain-containing protein [Pseudomonadota bacterium]